MTDGKNHSGIPTSSLLSKKERNANQGITIYAGSARQSVDEFIECSRESYARASLGQRING